MTKFTENRTLGASDMRALCIRKNWYTQGCNREYEHLLTLANKENITTDDILEMAIDIKEHSNGSDFELEVTNIMFEIARVCTTFFEEV